MWDGASDAIAWADAGNWGGVDYPRTNNDKATIPTSLAHSITTAGAITIGELDMQTGCTADITLGGNMIVDDAGSEAGTCTITAGGFDANGHDLAVDRITIIDGGTLTGGSGNHMFSSAGVSSSYGLDVRSGTFAGGSGNHTISSALFRTGNVTWTSGTTDFVGRFTGDIVIRFGTPTFDDGNGTVKFSRAGAQLIRDDNNTARTVYNLTVDGSGNTTQFFNAQGFNLTVDNNFVVNDGEFDTSEDTSGTSRNLVVTATTTIGDGSGAASSAKLTCNSSTVDLNGAWTVDTDGELSMPDSSGAFTWGGGNGTIKGVITANGGTLTYDGTAQVILFIYTDATFYNITNASPNDRVAILNQDAAVTLTIQNALAATGSAYFSIASDTGAGESLTLVLGTTTASGTISDVNHAIWLDENNGGINIQAASPDFPVIVTGTDWDWDYDPANIAIQDIDYRIAATTGGGGVTVTATRCKFGLGATISSGDIVKIAANTASGFKKVEGGGTLQIVRGGGVVILDGIADPVNLQNVALPTELNPAQICCNYIQGVSS